MDNEQEMVIDVKLLWEQQESMQEQLRQLQEQVAQHEEMKEQLRQLTEKVEELRQREDDGEPKRKHQKTQDTDMENGGGDTKDSHADELVRFLDSLITSFGKGTKERALQIAAREGAVVVLKHLLNLGADPNYCDPLVDAKKYTPLHMAAANGQAATAKVLLDNGARIEAQASGYWTPLCLAAQFGHTQVTKLLLDRGARTEPHTTDRNTPLHQAASFGHLQVVQLLVKHGADTTARNRYGNTAEDRARQWRHFEVADWLAERTKGKESSSRANEDNSDEITEIEAKSPLSEQLKG